MKSLCKDQVLEYDALVSEECSVLAYFVVKVYGTGNHDLYFIFLHYDIDNKLVNQIVEV